MGAALLVAVQAVRADDMDKMGMATPSSSSTPVMKHKVKKAKKKAALKKMEKAVWVCPMGDYSGPETADGKCPKCGMDLVEKK